MYLQEKGKNPRSSAMLLDGIHIIIGLVIVVLAVLTFLYPEDHMLMFPLIFFLASCLNLINGGHRLYAGRREKKRRFQGLGTLLLGIALMVLAAISAISIWWR